MRVNAGVGDVVAEDVEVVAEVEAVFQSVEVMAGFVLNWMARV